MPKPYQRKDFPRPEIAATTFAYWAGVFDSLGRAVCAAGASGCPIPRLRVSTLDEEYAKRIVRELGGTYIVERREGRKVRYIWKRTGRRAQFIVDGMYRFFIRHREEAEAILAWRSRKSPGRPRRRGVYECFRIPSDMAAP